MEAWKKILGSQWHKEKTAMCLFVSWYDCSAFFVSFPLLLQTASAPWRKSILNGLALRALHNLVRPNLSMTLQWDGLFPEGAPWPPPQSCCYVLSLLSEFNRDNNSLSLNVTDIEDPAGPHLRLSLGKSLTLPEPESSQIRSGDYTYRLCVVKTESEIRI